MWTFDTHWIFPKQIRHRIYFLFLCSKFAYIDQVRIISSLYSYTNNIKQERIWETIEEDDAVTYNRMKNMINHSNDIIRTIIFCKAIKIARLLPSDCNFTAIMSAIGTVDDLKNLTVDHRIAIINNNHALLDMVNVPTATQQIIYACCQVDNLNYVKRMYHENKLFKKQLQCIPSQLTNKRVIACLATIFDKHAIINPYPAWIAARTSILSNFHRTIA